MPTPFTSRTTSEHSGSQFGAACPGRVASLEAKNPVDWDTNVVDFISTCRHPGLVRRISFGTSHASHTSHDTSFQRKTGHRRNLSAMTTMGFNRQPDVSYAFSRPPFISSFCPQRNNYNSTRKPSAVVPYSLYGHTRNISDPTSCWEQYQFDHSHMGAPLFFEPSVYPVLSLSRQLSTNTPDRVDGLSTSDELKGRTSPYVTAFPVEYPAWEDVCEVKQEEILKPCEVVDGTVTREEQCLFTCLQPCAAPLTVLFGLSFIMFVQTMVASGLISSMLTTLEQRFNFTSRQMGYMISCFEGSGVLTTVAISFINGRRHNRLRVVGLSTLLVSCGFALFTVPHFLIGPYDPEIRNFTPEETPDPHKGRLSSDTGNSSADVLREPCMLFSAQNLTQPKPVGGNMSPSANQLRSVELFIFCISMVLAGVGGSPINVLGPTYLWDNLSSKQYPIYSALFYSAGGLGPACGFLAGAGFLSVFIDYPFRRAPPGLTRNNPLWLGNWWLGIIICAVVSFAAACPVIAFPKRLSSKKYAHPTVQPIKLVDPNPVIDSYKQSSPPLSHRDVKVPETSNSVQRLYDLCLSRVHSTRVHDPKSAAHRTTSESALPSSNSLPKRLKSDLRRTASVGCYPQKSDAFGSRPVALTVLPDKTREKIKAYLLVLRRVLTNPIWLGVTLTSMVEHSVVAAFLTFVSKYIQGLFQVPAYLASIHTGAVVVPSSLLGVLSGALFMRHYRPRIDRALIAVSIVIGITVLTTICLMLIGCPSNRLAGVTATYDGRPWPWVFGPIRLLEPNLTAPCNVEISATDFPLQRSDANIRCSTLDFNPVCWQRVGRKADTDGNGDEHIVDQMTFFNPCFAGCHSVHKPSLGMPQRKFLNCTCVTADSLNPLGSAVLRQDAYVTSGSVTVGRCPAKCPQYPAFLALLFVHILLTGALQNPSNVITLSCVSPEDSSVALGLQVFLMRTLAYIPAPIYFGQLFDFVCQFRLGPTDSAGLNLSRDLTVGPSTGCSPPSSNMPLAVPLTHASEVITPHQQSSGACLQYNLEGLPLVWLGLVLALKLGSLVGAIFTWHVARNYATKSQSTPDVAQSLTTPKHPAVSTGVRSLPSLRGPDASCLPAEGLGEPGHTYQSA